MPNGNSLHATFALSFLAQPRGSRLELNLNVVPDVGAIAVV